MSSTAPPRVLKLNPKDNVAVAVAVLQPEELIDLSGGQMVVRQRVPAGHKVALEPIGPGEPVIKYGEVIGVATRAVGAGEHVHVHNVVSARLPGPGERV